MNIFWYLPTSGDGHFLGTGLGGRAVTFPYLQQIATAVDQLGYGGVLLPTGRTCEDAWILASSLWPVTQRLKFLVAVRPGLLSPAIAARMAATLDRISNGRLLINVVTGGDSTELAGDGLHLDHDARYALTEEFLTVWRSLLQGHPTTFSGNYLEIKGGENLFPPVQDPYPPLYFGGSSLAGKRVAAKHCDVYLSWGEPPDQVAEKIREVRQLAAEQGRSLRFGIRLHVIVRRTTQAAWEAADELIQYVEAETITQAQQSLAQADSEGQRRMSRLHGGNRSQLEVSPNLWAGVGLVRGGAGTALVGDGATVAARIQEYANLGIDTFIFSGYPHLEEAYRLAELVFPHLELDTPAPNSLKTFFGEIIGDRKIPSSPAPLQSAS